MKITSYNYHSSNTLQKGFSLIELMVSIAIGLILLAALSTLFVGQSKSRDELAKANRMIDNGRYALDVLTDSLSLAGFYGELDPSAIAVPTTLPDPCSNVDTVISAALPFHVQGYNAAGPASTISSAPTCVPSTIKAGSDILVIRRAHTVPITAAAASADTTFLQVSLCTVETGTTGNVYKLAKAPASYNLSKKSCTGVNSGPFADLRRFLVQIYFIDSNNVAGDGIPTLKMAELSSTNTFVITPLVEGIEYMQVDYGIDNNNDGVLDGSYTSCSACTTDDWSHVVSVKVNLISRNLETTNNYTDSYTYNLGSAGNVVPNDAYKRHAYTQVIRLTNPASRKE